MGKPAGLGRVGIKQQVKAGEASDPFLMNGFDKKVLHLRADKSVRFKIEVDLLGDGTWATHRNLAVNDSGYAHHEFTADFSTHWVRLTAGEACNATATLIYN